MIVQPFSVGLSFGSLLLKVCNAENNGEDDTEGAHDNIADGEEVVFATECVGGGEDEALLAVEAAHVVVVLDPHRVRPRRQIILHPTIQLPEVGQTSSSHPNNEMFICDINPLRALPVAWHVFELVLFVTVPGDAGVIDGDVERLVCRHSRIVSVVAPVQLERVIEDALRHEAARISCHAIT
jgi:hypothetical protein